MADKLDDSKPLRRPAMTKFMKHEASVWKSTEKAKEELIHQIDDFLLDLLKKAIIYMLAMNKQVITVDMIDAPGAMRKKLTLPKLTFQRHVYRGIRSLITDDGRNETFFRKDTFSSTVQSKGRLVVRRDAMRLIQSLTEDAMKQLVINAYRITRLANRITLTSDDIEEARFMTDRRRLTGHEDLFSEPEFKLRKFASEERRRELEAQSARIEAHQLRRHGQRQ